MAKAVSLKPTTSGQMRLEKWDPDGDSYVIFQEPRRGEQQEIDTLLASSEITYADGGREIKQRDRMPLSVQEEHMVARTLVECNVPEEDSDKPIFYPGKTCRAAGKALTGDVSVAFGKVWRNLPGKLADEIVELMGEFYPPFSWRGTSEE